MRNWPQRAPASPHSKVLIAAAFLSVITLVFFGGNTLAQAASGAGPVIGWQTNGPGVFRVCGTGIQAVPGPVVVFRPPPTNLPGEVRRVMLMLRSIANVTAVTNTTTVFDHFLPDSLNNAIWTNFIARTNGRSMAIWSVRQRPPDWPARPVQVRWNPKSLIWGMKGLTALSPSWQGEGPPGGAPITALTRRHGYTRGHSMGPDGFRTDLAGQRVWFLTTDSRIVETKILRHVVRTMETSHRDYTLFLFASDLPPSIEPMRVAHVDDVFTMSHGRYPYCPGAPSFLFKTEQGGNVSAGMPGFTLDTMKMGDSGSPNMLPLPGELVFLDGRTTSGPSPEMQADMDRLCRLEDLDPSKYQLQFVDLSRFPVY